ncbi:MAG TPA: bacteriohemerythrin [Campylobacter avium]|uniref:bacteriohemerythrin n=1 Tax=Campylobacter avium TaxID=522485 RepID=UPI001D54B81F|nr:bacteriohemerythrin [Campylobacter avium]HJE65578.1 bacteriohemerythrin [Campylobacter avium]
MLPKWEDNFSVYNAKIDEQHKKLFEMAAHVERISDRAVSKAEVKNLLADFFSYMKEHFYDEEKYMASIGYPDLPAHKNIHKDIIQTMIELIQDIKSTNDLKEKLYVVAKNWLLEHILFEDMKVANYRRSLLATDDGSEVTFEVEEEEAQSNKAQTYLYSCECEGKLHDVPYNIHKKIKSGKNTFNCKVCKKPIKLHQIV